MKMYTHTSQQCTSRAAPEATALTTRRTHANETHRPKRAHIDSHSHCYAGSSIGDSRQHNAQLAGPTFAQIRGPSFGPEKWPQNWVHFTAPDHWGGVAKRYPFWGPNFGTKTGATFSAKTRASFWQLSGRRVRTNASSNSHMPYIHSSLVCAGRGSGGVRSGAEVLYQVCTRQASSPTTTTFAGDALRWAHREYTSALQRTLMR